MRAITATEGDFPAVAEASAVLGPAENYRGRIPFRYVVPLSGVLVVLFGALYLSDRRAGGYRVERLNAA